jgi:hypothetical protein
MLIAGTSSETLANENKGRGGLFTTAFLEALQEAESGALGRMTYQKLVEAVNRKLAEQRSVLASLDSLSWTTLTFTPAALEPLKERAALASIGNASCSMGCSPAEFPQTASAPLLL